MKIILYYIYETNNYVGEVNNCPWGFKTFYLISTAKNFSGATSMFKSETCKQFYARVAILPNIDSLG